MTDEELDRILSSDDGPAPAPTFTASVMAAVHRQAEDVRPPFPWLRFAVGIGASATMAFSGAAMLSQQEIGSIAVIAPELCYAIATLLVSLGLASIPRILDRS